MTCDPGSARKIRDSGGYRCLITAGQGIDPERRRIAGELLDYCQAPALMGMIGGGESQDDVFAVHQHGERLRQDFGMELCRGGQRTLRQALNAQ